MADEDRAQTLRSTIFAIYVFTLLACTARISIRKYFKIQLNTSNYLVTTTTLLFTCSVILTLITISQGFSRDTRTIPIPDNSVSLILIT